MDGYPIVQYCAGGIGLPFRVNRFSLLVWIFLAAVSLGGCVSPLSTSPPVDVTSAPASATSQVVPSVTPAPTATTTPPAELAILLAPQGSDPAQAEKLRSALEGAIVQAGLRWEVRTVLNPQEQGLKLVIALPPDPGVENLALAAPQVQFVAVGMSGLQPTNNLSLVGGESRFDQQGFIAGVIAAMLTPDWRVGVIGMADTPEGKAARNGFMNGAVYFCGLCLAYHGPIFDYPLYVELPSEAGQADWQVAVDELVRQAVQTVYVYPGIATSANLERVAQAGMKIISSGTPPQGLEGRWIASIDEDPVEPILVHLPDLLAGNGGFQAPMGLILDTVNSDLFSPGRQALAEKILADLLSEWIDTGVDVLSGEHR